MPIIYKCPNCGAAMEFDSTTQKLGCKRCGTQLDVKTYEREYSSLIEDTEQEENSTVNENASKETQRGGVNAADMKIYHCQSCGAELVADEYTSATFCSYCGNPTLVQDRLQGDFTPQSIIPFKINKDQAVEIYRKWLKKGPLTPKALSRTSTIEKISGVYVPFWLYSYRARTRMNASAKNVRTETRGDTEYTYTDHFDVYRDVEAEFEKIPADASEKMPDREMDMLEPYNYADIEGFSMPYLSGYLSERYNYTAEQIENRAKDRAKGYIEDITRDTITGYTSVTTRSTNTDLDSQDKEYALLPVWMLNFRYNNKEFHFYLNGQTGKIVADRPISVARAFSYGIGIFVAVLIITMIGGLLFI